MSFDGTNCSLSSIYLSCVWSNLSEDIVVDNEAFIDLNPQQSNDWSLTLFTMFERCELQLTDALFKFADHLKRTITVSQLLGGSYSVTSSASSSSLAGMASSAGDDEEQLKKAALDKLATSSSSSASRRLDRMVNLSSNIVEKATNKMRINLINDDPGSLPLDKGFLDYIMDVRTLLFLFGKTIK